MTPMLPWQKLLIGAGIALIIIGLVSWLLQGRLQWFGRLPGDIVVEKENFRFYAPIVTMLIISLLLNLVIWVVRRFF